MRKLFGSRFKKILKKDGRTFLLAFDHGVEHGPHKYEGIDLNPQRIVDIAAHAADAVILHVGAMKRLEKIPKRLGLVIKVTARTNLAPNMIQEIVTSVEEAVSYGADAISATVYVGNEYEYKMLRNLAEIKRECLKYDLPLLGFMYPRVKGKPKNDVIAVRYAARLGSELGLDLIKTYYTGSKQSFSKVVRDAFAPVVAAGGMKTGSIDTFFKEVKDVIASGAAGLAIGRNVWMRKNAIEVAKRVRQLVHGKD